MAAITRSRSVRPASHHGFTIWDSVVLAAAAEAECRWLLSEDLAVVSCRG
jgi:predicted nucleic acid-binding protein